MSLATKIEEIPHALKNHKIENETKIFWNEPFRIYSRQKGQTLHSSSLQEAFSLIESKYEIPEDVDENVLRTLGKDVEMQTFKTNISEHVRNSTNEAIVLQ